MKRLLRAAALSSLMLVPVTALVAAGAPPESAAVAEATSTRTAEDPKLVWTASHVVLVTQELAPGVYAVFPDDSARKNPAGVPAATSGGFVVGDDGVLVIDSMLNRRLAGQLLALIKERTDKPIRYVVNTSYHGDHSYGNQFFPAGTQFVQHVNTQRYIQSHFAEDVAFMTKNFGSNQGLDEITPQRAHILLDDGAAVTLDLGGKQVQVMHRGFAQTAGDLFVWLPEQKVLFTGNPIIAEAPALPWLLDGKLEQSLATVRKLRTMLPDGAVVVPGHGRPTDARTLDFLITYLEDLKQQTAAAVAKGLSEEDTVKQLSESMKQYNGYTLYPWVHSQINVTKTYQEMRAGGGTP